MISLNPIDNAGEALQYFSKDNYYTQEDGLAESEWFGRGAAQLGLQDQVDKVAFFNLLNGEVEGQELGKWVRHPEMGEPVRDHRPGIDMTFSAPKSVSLMAEVYGQKDVRIAHELAVKQALGFIETHLAGTRQTVDGKTEWVSTGNLAVAMFRHNTSRDLDPQTHTHAVIMNATQRDDGQWRSTTNESLFDAQRTIGAIYNAELAHQLQTLGYELYRTDEKGNFDIAGMTREQLEHFSQRRAAIKAELASKGTHIAEATAQQKEDATLRTRERKKDVDHGALIADWKTRAQEMGVDFEAIEAKAAAWRSQGGVVRDDALQGRQAMEFAAAHLIEREIVVSKNALLAIAIEHGAGRVAPSEVEKAFAMLEKNGDLVRVSDGHVTTKKMLHSERWSLEQVRTQKGQTAAIMDREAVAKRLDLAERQHRISYSAGQKAAITHVLTSDDRYVAIQGLAGTGKTTMLRALREIAQEQGITVRGMAPTGAASKVLTLEAGIVSDTVSMFQIKARQLEKNVALLQQTDPDASRGPELWVVDESSFLSQRQKAQVDHLAQKAGAKVVYLGDALQLQGVEAGKPFELAQREGMETASMTDINRQKTPELIQAVAILVGQDRLAEPPLPQVQLTHTKRAFECLDKQGFVHEVKEKDALVSTLVTDYLALAKDEQNRTMILTAYNSDRQAINARVRQGLKEQGSLAAQDDSHDILVSKGWTRAMQKEAQYYQVGDVVRFGRDYQQIDAKKGEYAKVMAVDAPAGQVLLKKEDGSTLTWYPIKHTKVEVYQVESRALALGDLIRLTRNGDDLKNGDIGRICSVNGHHDVIVELRQGDTISQHSVNLSQNRHWDHAYASTVHAAQGTTQYRAFFHIRAPETDTERRQERALHAMAKVFGDRSFYVGVTRASHECRIYTNDKEVAAKAVGIKQDKSSAVERLSHSPKPVTAPQQHREHGR